MGKDHKVMRVSPEQARANAKAGGSGRNFCQLPKGVRTWEPEKAGTYKIDFLPYEVTVQDNPDQIQPQHLWWKRPFYVHRNIGVNNVMVVCPQTINKPCPICEKRKQLAANYEANKEAIKGLSYQKWNLYNIIDPEDKDKVAVMQISAGKFARTKAETGIEVEMETADQSLLSFYDVTEDGKTVVARFAEASFVPDGGGQPAKFITISRIDFEKRKPMDEAKILAKTVDLDRVWDGIMSYEQIEALFLQIDGAKIGKKSKTATSKPAPASEPEELDEDKDDDKDSDEDGKESAAESASDSDFKVGSAVMFVDDATDKKISGKIISIDGQIATVEEENGDEHDVDMDDLAAVDVTEDADPEEPEEDEQDDADADAEDTEPTTSKRAVVGSIVRFKDEEGSSIRGKVLSINDSDDCVIKDESGKKHTLDIDELMVVPGPTVAKTEKAKPSASAKTIECGDTVKDDDGDEGVVISIVNGKVKFSLSDDTKKKAALDDVVLVRKGNAEADGDEKEDAEDAAPTFNPGDRVTWDNGNETGEVVKIKNDKVKIKDDDTDQEMWKLASELSAAKKGGKK